MKHIPRVALVWILLAVAASLGLHALHLPLWMWTVVVFVAGWRWMVHLGRFPYPNKTVKTLAVIAATSAVVLSFGQSFSLESASAFLVAAAILKVLEMRNRRDGQIVIFLCYFLLAVGFLFDQGIMAAVTGIVVVWLITTALIALQQNHGGSITQRKTASTLSLRILLVSLPFMLIIYLVFPRLGPLWSVGLQSDQARTGLSDSMSPGDIANLSQSDELAFRVSFKDDEVPAREERYFRGVILDHYDGRSWKPSARVSTEWAPESWQPPAGAQGVLEYEIIQEPTDQKWLFALRGVAAVEKGTGMTSDDRLVNRRPVYQRKRYSVVSWPSVRVDHRGLSQRSLSNYTRLPAERNPRTVAWARQFRQQFTSDAEYMNGLWNHFRQQPFFYTLKPPVLGEHDIDEFLFDSRRGFCAHYSGAMTFAARAVGIPARVVAGYQGGEWHDDEKYLSVRQYDAHAWIEVWIKDRGWLRIDPTAAVSPERIELGLEAAMQEEGSFLDEQLFSAHKLKGINWINQLRLQIDSLNYYWQRWVLSYDNQRQSQLLSSVLGIKSYEKLLYGIAALFAVVFLGGALIIWWGQRPKSSSGFMKAWQKLQKRAQRLGLEAHVGETPGQYLQRVEQTFPATILLARELNKKLVHYFYIAEARNKQAERELIKMTGRLRRTLRKSH